MGSAGIDTAPAITVTIAMTMATIGRRMKKFDTSYRLAFEVSAFAVSALAVSAFGVTILTASPGRAR